MEALFAEMLEKNTPKFNEDVVNGLATIYLSKSEDYLHNKVWRSAAMSFPPGLEYVGYSRCSYQEEFDIITKVSNNKRVFDLASSDIYLVKYHFKYLGEDLPPVYIYLLFAGEGGITHLGGVKYHITPVLSDKVISPGHNTVFVRLLRDKMLFKSVHHTFIVNDVRETVKVVWSRIHRKGKKARNVGTTTNSLTCCVHYLLAKYGFNETFSRYVGMVPVIGTNDITPEKYPYDKWIICESTQVKPKTFKGNFYEPTNIKIAIPKEYWNNTSKALIIGFFYVVDHFPNRIKVDYVNDTSLWMILLGHIIWSGVYGENKLYTSVLEHFNSLESYIDTVVAEKLKHTPYKIDNFYDLLNTITSNYSELILRTSTTISSVPSLYGKNLEVLYYVLYDITSSIFNLTFNLGNLASRKDTRNPNDPLRKKDITDAFNRCIKPRKIFGLRKNNLILEPVSYSGDNMFPKITSKLSEQESLPNSTGTSRLTVGPDKHIEKSMVEATSVLFISKTNPACTGRINPFINLDISTGTIIPNPKLTEALEELQRMLLSN